MTNLRIAITIGDPAGIGPEIILKAIAELQPRVAVGELALLTVGCGNSYRNTAAALGLPLGGIEFLRAEHSGSWPALGFIEAGPAKVDIPPGLVSAEAGRLAYNAIDIAVRLALDGQVHAICTAPLNKEALNLAGHHFNGHTELLASLTGTRDSVMMLAHGNMQGSRRSQASSPKDSKCKARYRATLSLSSFAPANTTQSSPSITTPGAHSGQIARLSRGSGNRDLGLAERCERHPRFADRAYLS